MVYMLTSNLIRTMSTFINYKRTESQEGFYKRNKATEEVMTFMRTSNKAFGEKIRKKLPETRLDWKKKNQFNTAISWKDYKIEQKSARYGKDGTFDYQLIEPEVQLGNCFLP